MQLVESCEPQNPGLGQHIRSFAKKWATPDKLFSLTVICIKPTMPAGLKPRNDPLH